MSIIVIFYFVFALALKVLGIHTDIFVSKTIKKKVKSVTPSAKHCVCTLNQADQSPGQQRCGGFYTAYLFIDNNFSVQGFIIKHLLHFIKTDSLAKMKRGKRKERVFKYAKTSSSARSESM